MGTSHAAQSTHLVLHFTRSIVSASSGHEIPPSLRAFPARHLD